MRRERAFSSLFLSRPSGKEKGRGGFILANVAFLGFTAFWLFVWARPLAAQLDFLADDWFFLELLSTPGPGALVAAFSRLMNGVFFRPAAALLWIFDFQRAQLDPAPYHLSNFVLHCLNAYLLSIFMWRITRLSHAAFLTGIFFLLHPVQAEAVFWIAGRFDLICLTFLLLTFLFYPTGQKAPSLLRFFPSAFCALLAMLSKETALASIPLLLFLEISRKRCQEERGEDSRQIKRRVLWRPLGVWVSVYLLYFLLRKVGNGEWGMTPPSVEVTGTRIISSLGIALRHLLGKNPGAEAEWLLYAGAMLFFLAAASFLFSRPCWSNLLLGAVFLFFPLLPALVLPWDVKEWTGTRLLYLPAAGLSLMLALIFSPGVSRWRSYFSFLLATGLAGVFAFQLNASRKPYLTAGRMIGAVRMMAEQVRGKEGVAEVYLFDFPRSQEGVMLFLNDNTLTSALHLLLSSSHGSSPSSPPLSAFHAGRVGPLEYLPRSPSFEAIRNGNALLWKYEAAQGTVLDWTSAVELALERRAAMLQALSVPLPPLVLAEERRLTGLFLRGELEQLGDFSFRRGREGYFESAQLQLSPLLVDRIEITMKVRPDHLSAGGEYAQLYWRKSLEEGWCEEESIVFPVKTDGQFHVYSLELGRNPAFFLLPQLVRLRFDPLKKAGLLEIEDFIIYPLRHSGEEK